MRYRRPASRKMARPRLRLRVRKICRWLFVSHRNTYEHGAHLKTNTAARRRGVVARQHRQLGRAFNGGMSGKIGAPKTHLAEDRSNAPKRACQEQSVGRLCRSGAVVSEPTRPAAASEENVSPALEDVTPCLVTPFINDGNRQRWGQIECRVIATAGEHGSADDAGPSPASR